VGKCVACQPETARVVEIYVHRMWIEAHAVGEVEYFPAELELGVFVNLERFIQACIPGEISISPQWIACAGLSGIGLTETFVYRIRIAEHLLAFATLCSSGRNSFLLNSEPFDVPVGRPLGAVINRIR